MVSTELLRRYSFFSGLSDGQLKTLSAIAEEKMVEANSLIFEECDNADKIFLLIDGNVDLSYRSIDEMHIYTTPPKEFYAGSINPGEVFGISSLIEPYSHNATAKVSESSRIILFDAIELRKLLEQDSQLAYNLTRQTVKVLMDRLIDLRVQLVATQP
jgi:CRP/FNR family transcriptional regulator, cyclic AMP receptor protein